MSSGPSRRNVLRLCLGGALAGSTRAAEKSRVAIARDPALRPNSGDPTDSARLLSVLDRAIQATYATDSPLEAWKSVVQPGEVVGLKVNCLAGRGASTNPMLVEAICERLQQAGIPPQDIVIWDRLNADLDRAGFQVSTRKDRIRCIGNDAAGYEQELAIFGKRRQPAFENAHSDLRCGDQPARAQGPRHRRRHDGAQEPVRRHSQSEQVPHRMPATPTWRTSTCFRADPAEGAADHLRRHRAPVRRRTVLHAALDVAV